MDPATIRELVANETDVLTPAVKAEEQLYKNTRCPVCYEGGCQKKIRPPTIVMTPQGPQVTSSPFKGGLLAEGYAHCINCSTDFNPRTGVIYSTEASMIHELPEGPLQE